MRRAIALALVCASPSFARAETTVTTTNLVELHGDNKNEPKATDPHDDDNYGAGITRTTLTTSSDDLEAQARLDAVGFAKRPSADYQNTARLERLSATAHVSDFELVLGDAYRQLGRGLLLSLRKEDAVGLDVTLRGGAVGYQAESSDIVLFAGLTNPSNLDAVSEKYLPDPNDAMAGGKYALHQGALELGLMGLVLRPRERLLPDSIDHTEAGGIYADWPALTEWLALYLEAAAEQRTLAGSRENGYAGYATADLRFGDTTLLLEGTYLRDFEIRGSTNEATGKRFSYSRAPTLQRLEEEVVDAPSAVGGRARVSQKLEPLTVYVNALYRIDNFGLTDAVTALHGWAGGELSYSGGAGRVNLSGGYRLERQQGALVKRLTHVDGDWIQPVVAGAALHLATSNELRWQRGLGRFVRGSTFAGIDWVPVGGTFELGYDTQDPTVRNLFYAGIVTARLGNDWKIDGTFGTQRGGIKCVAGVCRTFPPFAGAKLEVTARF